MSCHVSVIWEAGKFGKGETGYRLKVNEVKTLQSYCGFCGLAGCSIIYALESGWFDSLSGWPVWSSVSPGLCSSLSCLSLPISLKSGRNMSLGEDIKTTTANFVVLKKKNNKCIFNNNDANHIFCLTIPVIFHKTNFISSKEKAVLGIILHSFWYSMFINTAKLL